MEQVTSSGLVITDRRHNRSDVPRDNVPNENDPIGSVGPNVPMGFGDTHVMYPSSFAPVQAQAWNGWPVEWMTPMWGGAVGLSSIISRSSIVWASIDLNASVISTMPVYTTKASVPQDSLPSWTSNPQPEVYVSWEEFMKELFTSYMLGEAFVWCTSRFATGYPATFLLLNPAWVNVEFIDGTRRYELGGVDITNDVLHIRYTTWPGDAHGHGPLEAATNNLMGLEAMERYAATLAQRGGIPWGVLTHPGNLRGAQAGELQQAFVSARLSQLGAPAVLSGGVTLTPMTLNPRDMALLELRQFDEARLAVLLSVPPALLALPSGDSMTYSNIESFFDFHWRAYLRPKAQAIMAAFSHWALPRGVNVELNRDEYTRPAFGERVNAYKTLHDIIDSNGQRGISVAEIRVLERMAGSDTSGGSIGADALSGALSG